MIEDSFIHRWYKFLKEIKVEFVNIFRSIFENLVKIIMFEVLHYFFLKESLLHLEKKFLRKKKIYK